MAKTPRRFAARLSGSAFLPEDALVPFHVIAGAAGISRQGARNIECDALAKLQALTTMNLEGEPNTMTPSVFYQTERVRNAFDAFTFLNIAEIAKLTKHSEEEVFVRLTVLANAGYAEKRGPSGVYALTDEGRNSIGHSAPPISDDPTWAMQIMRALAALFKVEPADVLGATFGPAVVARARLCHALHVRGWTNERIEKKFSFPAGWADAGIARWKRVKAREEGAPVSELRLKISRKRIVQAQGATA